MDELGAGVQSREENVGLALNAVEPFPERYRLAAKSAGVGVYDADLVADTLYWSPEMWSILGLPKGSPPPPHRDIPPFIHPDDLAVVGDMFSRAFDPAGDGVVSSEHRIVFPSGSVRWVQVRGQVQFAGDGDQRRPTRNSGVVIDITDRKRAEEALRDSEDKYRTLFNSIDEGFTIVEVFFEENGTVNYRFLETNPAFEKITHLSGAVGKTVRELLPDLESYWFEVYAGVAMTGAPARFEQVAKDIPGIFDVYAFRIGVPEQRRVAILFTDVSERRRREQELKRSNEDLQTFAYTASHDLQQPLRTISIYCDLLRRGLGEPVDPEARKYLALMKNASDRMQDLIQDLLSYSRLQIGSMEDEVIDMNAIVRLAVSNLSSVISETAADVTWQQLPSVRGDYARYLQLMQNLIGNALKYRSKAPPRVLITAITARQDASECTFSVSDNGIGIDPKYHQDIFEMFRRLHSEKEFPGTGIGLALCRRIVELQGGRIWVDSASGAGSTFSFTLPAARQFAASN